LEPSKWRARPWSGVNGVVGTGEGAVVEKAMKEGDRSRSVTARRVGRGRGFPVSAVGRGCDNLDMSMGGGEA
jgi:hypothetical protein